MRLYRTYGVGEEHYAIDNWRNGIPWDNILDHLQNHIILWMQGDKSEDHLAHAAWGLFTLMDYEVNHPELDNIHTDNRDGIVLFPDSYPMGVK